METVKAKFHTAKLLFELHRLNLQCEDLESIVVNDEILMEDSAQI
jgi:hypothetical protein